MHLTNYSLNKKNEDYEFNLEASFDTGSKRTFSFVMKHLERIGYNPAEVLEDIKFLMRMLMISLHPFLCFDFDCQFKDPDAAQCFQVIGVDVMFDDECKPWLIEINGNPSLNMDHKLNPEDKESEIVVSPIDKYIKEKVLEPTIELIMMDKEKRKKLKIFKDWENLELE